MRQNRAESQPQRLFGSATPAYDLEHAPERRAGAL